MEFHSRPVGRVLDFPLDQWDTLLESPCCSTTNWQAQGVTCLTRRNQAPITPREACSRLCCPGAACALSTPRPSQAARVCNRTSSSPHHRARPRARCRRGGVYACSHRRSRGQVSSWAGGGIQQARPIEAAIALRYPEDRREAYDLHTALSSARLSYCVFTEGARGCASLP